MRLAGLALLLPVAAMAHDFISTRLVWTNEISRIVYRHCASCHREGGGAMPLLTYEQARPWAKAIRDEVLSRRMPLWGAATGVGEFRDDPSLSQVEIEMIVNWVEGGAPEGDAAYLPPMPRLSESAPAAVAAREWVIGTQEPRVLSAATSMAGIRPRQIATGGWLEVTATEPDGTVHRLIWLRHWRPEWQRTFYFREPIHLPRGTRLWVYSDGPAEVFSGGTCFRIIKPGCRSRSGS